MGFSGLFLLARSSQSLYELACVEAIGSNPARRSEWDHGGGWRLAQIPRPWYNPRPLVHELAEQTEAPALAMYVYDSGWAYVGVDSPGRAQHNFIMNPEKAELDDDYEPPPVDETVRALQEWAGYGGLSSSLPMLGAAITRAPGPFGEGVVALVVALGLPAEGERIRSE
jgi:hypothetical protein